MPYNRLNVYLLLFVEVPRSDRSDQTSPRVGNSAKLSFQASAYGSYIAQSFELTLAFENSVFIRIYLFTFLPYFCFSGKLSPTATLGELRQPYSGGDAPFEDSRLHFKQQKQAICVYSLAAGFCSISTSRVGESFSSGNGNCFYGAPFMHELRRRFNILQSSQTPLFVLIAAGVIPSREILDLEHLHLEINSSTANL